MFWNQQAASCTCRRAARVSLALLFSLTTRSLHAQRRSGPSALASLPNDPSYLLQQAASAPATSTITGDVLDVHNDLVPDATITAQQVPATAAATPLQQQTTSDSAGHFELRNLPAGTWTVTVTAPDLRTFLSPKINLKPGDKFVLQGIILPIAEQLADVTVTITTHEIAEQQIHDEEHQRVLGFFPNYSTSYVWNAAPLTTKQKFKLNAHATFDPVSLITAGLVASAEQIRGTFPGYGSGPEGFGKRYAAAWGDAFIGETLGHAIFPSIFRQDPRYFYMGTGTKKQRAIHALASGLFCRGDNGHTQLDVSHILGNFTAGYISSTYHPASTSALTLAVDNALIGIAGRAGTDFVREFFLRPFSTGTPKYANGKPIAAPH